MATVVIDGVRYELDKTKVACEGCPGIGDPDLCEKLFENGCGGHSWTIHESQPQDEWQGYKEIKYVPSQTQELKAFFGGQEFPSEAEEEHFKTLDEKLNKYDVVEKPKHYMLFEDKGIEVRDVCSKLVDKVREGSSVPFWKDSSLFESDYVQMLQYVMRFMDKNGVEDLKKARWYLDKMIDAYE